ncbi:MAG: penicillin-binding protein activator, partial [Methylococcales bacterium]|nr:penicillin-binding protein activator [Methylococcales bacterium]
MYSTPLSLDILTPENTHYMTPHKGLLLALGLSIAACSTAPKRQTPYTGKMQRAEQLVKQGNYSAAAQLYQQLAETAQPAQRNYFQLLAAEAIAYSTDPMNMRQFTDRIDPAALTVPQQSRFYLLLAQSDIHDNQVQAALAKLQRIHLNSLNSEHRPVYHRLKATALEAIGNPLDSARELSALNAYLHDKAAIKHNNDAIIAQLKQVPVQHLTQLSPPPPDIFAGWMRLTALFTGVPSGLSELESQVAQWRHNFPNHPADHSQTLTQLLEKYQQILLKPAKIAVILPRSGPYTSAAKAIREGLISAYYAQNNPEKAVIQFYDSKLDSPWNLIQQAMNDGADRIIGPLDKKNLQQLVQQSHQFDIPILALNHLPEHGNAIENLYEFSLRPEDEVEQVADSAWFDGHQHALILVPNTPFGQRLEHHFTEHWLTLGGEVVATQSYNPKQNDYSNTIKRLLRSKRSAGSGESTSSEADFIFLVAHPKQARLIQPQLQFYGSALPLYATAHIYKRRGNSARDHDLDGITFCDIPWLIDGSQPSSVQQPPALYLRLMALGFDAYNIIDRLHRLADNS